jgi:hypothetical protein
MFPLYDDGVQLVARSGTTYTPTITVTHSRQGAEDWISAPTDVVGDARLHRFGPPAALYREALRRDDVWQQWFHRR